MSSDPQQESSELLPCPLCGGCVLLGVVASPLGEFVFECDCFNCPWQGNVEATDRVEAVRRLNRRVPVEPQTERGPERVTANGREYIRTDVAYQLALEGADDAATAIAEDAAEACSRHAASVQREPNEADERVIDAELGEPIAWMTEGEFANGWFPVHLTVTRPADDEINVPAMGKRRRVPLYRGQFDAVREGRPVATEDAREMRSVLEEIREEARIVEDEDVAEFAAMIFRKADRVLAALRGTDK